MAQLKLPLHRLASGLRKAVGMESPVRNTFVHYDDVVDVGEESDVPVKCVSNLLDGMPMRWKSDASLLGHIQGIISSYRTAVNSKHPGVLSGDAVLEEEEEEEEGGCALLELTDSDTAFAVASANAPPASGVPLPNVGKDSSSCAPWAPEQLRAGVATPDGEAANSSALLQLGTAATAAVKDSGAPGADPFENRVSWSVGAAGHARGHCKPCAWNWKPSGCSKGEQCEYCHLCDESAMKRKQVYKMERRRQYRRRQTA